MPADDRVRRDGQALAAAMIVLPEPVADRPAAPTPPQGVRQAFYEGGTCTCDLIEAYGPPSERDT
ncbi:hypothetical protein [Streptomyces microflavus]|uniref:hypothetical protein n=1 Tax=Streptomyces microflavus TaxID=1919 RepID=UPI0036521D98